MARGEGESSTGGGGGANFKCNSPIATWLTRALLPKLLLSLHFQLFIININNVRKRTCILDYVSTVDIACIAGVNGEGEGEQEWGRKMGSGS